MPGARQRQSLVTTRFQDEGAVIAKDSQFMVNIADQDGDGLISMEEATKKVSTWCSSVEKAALKAHPKYDRAVFEWWHNLISTEKKK